LDNQPVNLDRAARQDGSSKYPATSITVHLDTHTSVEIPLACIRSITPPDEDGPIDVVYSASADAVL